MLNYDQTYEFSYVKTFTTRSGFQMFEIERDGETFNVLPRKYQLQNPPKTLRCRVKEITDNGYVKLFQELAFILEDYYKPGVHYDFTVIKELTGDNSGLPTYILHNDDTGLEHHFFSFDEKEYQVGEHVSLQTRIKEDKYGVPRLFFYVDDQEFDAFSPETVFSAISHGNLYEKYLKEFEPMTNNMAVIQEEMQEKIETGNRLWIFDYLKLLKHWSTFRTEENIQTAIDCNILIAEIEEWFLKSGMLSKFSSAAREETRLKAETSMAKALVDIEVLKVIRDGCQDSFISELTEKARKGEHDKMEDVYLKLLGLISADQDIIDTRLPEIAEIIAICADYIKDAGTLLLIIQLFKRKIVALKKQISTSIHYTRSSEVNKEMLADMTVGLGTLLLISGKLGDGLERFDTKSAFSELCKYLSFLTTPQRATALVNKALELIMGSCSLFNFDVNRMIAVSTNPEPFIDDVLGVVITHDDMIRCSSSDVCQMQYKDGRLVILPMHSHVKSMRSQYPVYDIPGTAISVAAGVDSESEWDLERDITYYKSKWENLASWKPGHGIPDRSGQVTVKVKSHNTLPNFVFCSIEGLPDKADAVFTHQEYLAQKYTGALTEVFEEGMCFRVPCLEQNGKLFLSIKDQIRKLSSSIAEKQSHDIHTAVCMEIINNWGYMVTASGAICAVKAKTSTRFLVEVGTAYLVVLHPEKEHCGVPFATVLGQTSCDKTAQELLKDQLRMLTVDVSEVGESSANAPELFKPMPYVLLTVDQYLRFSRNDIARYNLYHALMMIARSENSQLFGYYSSKIKYMEALSSFAAGETVTFEEDEDMISNFPSLKEQDEIISILRLLGNDNASDYLLETASRKDKSSGPAKMAGLVLASNIISRYGGPENLISELRTFIASELGVTPLVEDIHDDEENVSSKDNSAISEIYYYGSENQTQEFMTSIIFDHDTSNSDIDNQMMIVIKTVCGFLNALGGILWIGVDDDGKASGIEKDLKELDCGVDRYERIIRQNIVAQLGKDVNGTISFEFHDDGDKKVCKVIIPAYFRPVSINNDFFQRQGNETRVLKGNDLVLFVERKMMEKKSAGNPAIHVPDAPAIPLSLSSAESDTSTIWLNTYIDGTYMVSDHKVMDDRILFSQAIKGGATDGKAVLLCYDDGTVGKIPSSIIVGRKRDTYYNNGIYKGASLMASFLSEDTNILVVKHSADNTQIKQIKVSDIGQQKMFSVRGTQVVSASDAQYSWELVAGDEILVQNEKGLHGKEPAESSSESIGSTDPESVLCYWYGDGKEEQMREWLRNCAGREIPGVRMAISKVFGNRLINNEEFWDIVTIILESNALLFRKPLADAVKEYADISSLDCHDQVLNHVVELLLQDEDKVQQGLDFLLPFRSLLTKESKALLASKACHITMPEGFNVLFGILEPDYDRKLEILGDAGDNPAAYYSLFETLAQDEEENGIWHVRKNSSLNGILDRMRQSYAGNIVWELIRKIVFHEDDAMSDEDAAIYQSEGFPKLLEVMNTRKNQQMQKKQLDDMYAMIGMNKTYKVQAIYSNHYVLSGSGFRALLPKKFANREYREGDSATVMLRKAYKKEKLFLVTQLGAKTESLEKIDLVNIGEIVEVKFSKFNDKLFMDIPGMSPLTGTVVDYPRFFDYKKRYQAEVISAKFMKCELALIAPIDK